MGRADFGLRTDNGDLEVVEWVEEILLVFFLAHLAQLQTRHHDLHFLSGLFL